MSTHARLSASQTKRWWNCPGSIPAMAMFPELERPSGEPADMGTAAHRIVEESLTKGVMPDHFAGRIVQVFRKNGGTSILRKGAKLKGHTDASRFFLVDDDMIEATEVMVTYVLDRLEACGEPRDSVKAIKSGALLVESKVNPLPERDDTGGTGDVIINCFDMIEVIDYKNGSGVFVPVQGNHQLRTYMAGALNIVGWDEHETVRYTIVQPRHFNGGIMSEDITTEELKAWVDELRQKALEVDGATDDLSDMKGLPREECLKQMADVKWLSVGDDGSHCGFCDLKPFCPAVKNKVQELAQADFDEEPDTDRLPKPSGDGKTLAKFMPWLPLIDSWTKAVAAEAERLALSGNEVPGYKIVRQKGSRKFKDGATPEKIVGYLKANHLVDEETCFTTPEILSGPALEKLITRNNLPTDIKTVKDAKAAFSNEFLYNPDGGLALVPSSDRREAIATSADNDFDGEEI
jgi:hypothetical protein